MKSVAIIGAGFSGTMAAIHLRSQKEFDCRILMFDAAQPQGRGVAYGVDSTAFLLNVPAESMGAFPDKPRHFIEWMESKTLPYSGSDFVPRKIYGDYLQEMLASLALSRGGFEQRTVSVDNLEIISSGWNVISSDGLVTNVDAVVIATGYPRQSFSFLNPHLEQSYLGLEGCENIAIIGSGLTAVDVFEQTKKLRYNGNYTIISRSGKFPYVHTEYEVGTGELSTLIGIEASEISLRKVLSNIRKDILQFGTDRVLHDLRPYTVSLWQGFSMAEKKQFFRRLESVWNRIRHRMPQSSANTIAELAAANRLNIIRANFKRCEQKYESGYRISYQVKEEIREIEVDKAFDCRGPDSSPRSNSLVRILLEQGVIEISELQRGIKSTAKGRASREDLPPLYVIGPLRREELLETTAVRELREQVYSVCLALGAELLSNSK